MKLLKRLTAIAAMLVMVASPLVATATDSVQIESLIRVANVTGGQAVNYSKSVSAKTDDVVRAEVTYHNKEQATSGKVAQALTVKVNVPTSGGTITSTVHGANTNTVVDTATVNLSDANTNLEYIPGSAKWRHNKGTNENPQWVTESISDAVATSGAGLKLEDEKPCFNYAATVTVEMRVKHPNVSIVKDVKVDGQSGYNVRNIAKAGDTLVYRITIKNTGNTGLKQVQVADVLPSDETYVAGSSMLYSLITGPNGQKLSDDRIAAGGITLDDMAPGSTQVVLFKAKLKSSLSSCTDLTVKNTAGVKAVGLPYQYVNYAYTTVKSTKVCTTSTPPTTPETPTTPVPSTPLPETGMEGAAAGVLGTSSLGIGVSAYIRSKRNVVDALRGITKR